MRKLLSWDENSLITGRILTSKDVSEPLKDVQEATFNHFVHHSCAVVSSIERESLVETSNEPQQTGKLEMIALFHTRMGDTVSLESPWVRMNTTVDVRSLTRDFDD